MDALLDIFIENGYIHQNSILYAPLIFSGLEALSDSKGYVVMASELTPGYDIVGNLEKGTILRRNTIDKIIKNIKSLSPSRSRDFALQFGNELIKNLKKYNKYHNLWNKLNHEHGYHLLLDQMGMDQYTGKVLEDNPSKLLRHHIYFIKESILLKDLALTTFSLHRQISHSSILSKTRDPVGDQKLIESTKKLVKDLIDQAIFYDKKIEIKDCPAHWDFDDKLEFIERVEYYKIKGEKEWFNEYYKNFYKTYQNKQFWQTHLLLPYFIGNPIL